MSTATTEKSLTLNDLAAVVKMIDTCSERGAFKGNELAAIGALREKFNYFVLSATPQESVINSDTKDE
jgi:hypothetical protein